MAALEDDAGQRDKYVALAGQVVEAEDHGLFEGDYLVSRHWLRWGGAAAAKGGAALQRQCGTGAVARPRRF